MIEDTIFRVIQESATNAVRHGHASQIELFIFLRMKKTLDWAADNKVWNLTYGYGAQADDGATSS